MRYFLSITFVLFADFVYAASNVKDKAIPSLTNEPIGVGNYIQMFFGLFLVVAIIFGMAWLMRRLGSVNGTAEGNLKVLGGVSVGQRERVVLIQAGKTQLLIGVAPNMVRTLHVMDELIETTTDTNKNISSGFADKLQAAIHNRRNS